MKRQLSSRICAVSRIVEGVMTGGLLVGLACGCDDAARRPVAARAPVAAPYASENLAAAGPPQKPAEEASSANFTQKLPLVNPAAHARGSLDRKSTRLNS